MSLLRSKFEPGGQRALSSHKEFRLILMFMAEKLLQKILSAEILANVR